MVRPLVLAAVLAFARGASASERELALDLERAPEAQTCASSEVLRAKIAERLGRDPFTETKTTQSRLRVSFARAKGTWTADIALFDAHGAAIGARTLDEGGPTCDPLVASVVLTVTVLLEDLAPLSTGEPAGPPEATGAPKEPPPAPSDPPVVASPRSSAVPVTFDLALGVAGAIGVAPASVLGLEAVLAVQRARFRLELGARAHLPASSEGDLAVRTQLTYGRLAPCYGATALSACGVIAAGSISGEGVGARVEGARSEARPYAAAGIGVVSRAFLGRNIFARASADVLFSLIRADFSVGDTEIFSVPAASVNATLGLGVQLP